MSGRYVTIINPAAGGGRCGRRARAALERLRSGGLELEVHETTRAGEATDIAREAWRRGERAFLAVGGDGTSYEVVNGLFPCAGRERPRLGMVPLGTGNSFLRDFGVFSADDALKRIVRGTARSVDVVEVTHADGVLHFINLLSVGFTAEAGELTNRRYKAFGAAGYVIAVLSTALALRFPSFAVRLDGGPYDVRPCILLSFSNSRFTAGSMMMAPMADPTDGMLDVIRIAPMRRRAFIAAFPTVFRGTHIKRPDVEQGRARIVEVALENPVDVMVDGEIERIALSRMQVLPGALEVVA